MKRICYKITITYFCLKMNANCIEILALVIWNRVNYKSPELVVEKLENIMFIFFYKKCRYIYIVLILID